MKKEYTFVAIPESNFKKANDFCNQNFGTKSFGIGDPWYVTKNRIGGWKFWFKDKKQLMLFKMKFL